MSLDAAWFARFASPRAGPDHGIAELIAQSEAADHVARLIERARPLVPDTLVDMLLWGAASGLQFRQFWNPGMGPMRDVAAASDAEIVWRSVQLGLTLAGSGVNGSWDITTPGLAALRAGDMLLPEVASVGLTVGAGTARIIAETSDRQRCVLERRSGPNCFESNWRQLEGPSQQLAAIGTSYDASPRLLPDSGLPAHLRSRFADAVAYAAITPDIVDGLAAGFDLLRRAAPDWEAWIGMVLRDILVCRAPDGVRVSSGSCLHAPGLIHLSYPMSPIDIAESLVHEASHQYFYLIEHVGPVDDGSDRRLYWSPPIRRARPLGRVLMAYHAFANVRGLFRDVLRAGIANGIVAESVERLDETLRTLAEPLDGNPALTPLGRALFLPCGGQAVADAA